MKTLFISDVYFPRINGVSTSIETFRHELTALNHTVHLIAPAYATNSEDESWITRIPARNVPLDPEDMFMSYRTAMKLEAKLKDEKYDIVHIQTPFVAHYLGVNLSKRLGIPCVETYHTFFEEYLYHYIPFLPKSLLRHVAKRFSRHQGNSIDAMVVPSHPMLHVLKNYGLTTHAEVIPTGIEEESFAQGDRVAFRKKYGIEESRPMLLFVGRVAFEKNIGFLLQCLQQIKKSIPEVLLAIAGEGPALKSLKHEVKEMGLEDEVRFIGYLNRHTELNDCYSSADIFVFASRTETQGLVLLEAMAQGIPVVSTAELGTKDVLQQGKGVWIAKEEAGDFSEKVIAMLKDHEARKSLGIAAREYAHTWSASSQAIRMQDFYRKVISASQ
jgi:glycosyltransferase involved in cell wall biosynthesis